MSKLFKTAVKDNKKLSNNHYLITFKPLKKIKKPKPGQFFMLSVSNSLDPLLKRPFSLHRWLNPDFQILYRTVGKATKLLKNKKPGDILEILGPLGNGFPVRSSKAKILLVAGGLGIAPIFALAEAFADREPLLFLGAKNRKEALCVNKLKSIGIKPVITTDDGSLGKKGLITNKLKDFLFRHPLARLGAKQRASCEANGLPVTGYRLYACGPKPMLKELSKLAGEFKLKGYIALEENMACGIGACLSCVINTTEGYKRVCKEGPVFPIEEIIW